MKIAVCAFLILLSASANVYAIHWFLWSAPVSVRIGPIGPRSADLSVSCKPSRIIVGDSTSIDGELINATGGEGLGGQPIALYYKQSGYSLWNYITSVFTGLDGAYSHLWVEASLLISGRYVVNATFAGSIAFDRWTSITDLQVIPETPVEEIPIAILSASPTNIEAWGDVAFDASASYDPDGSIVSYWFDSGDGFDSGWTSSPTYTWFYTDAGVYYAKVKVKDNDGLISEWSEPDEIRIRLELIKQFFPYYRFSGPNPITGAEEDYYPCSFYFDDGNIANNKESYDENSAYPTYFTYIHEVQDETYLTIQYWLYYAYNEHWVAPDHLHDWDSTIFIVFDKSEFSKPFEEVRPVRVGFASHWWINYHPWSVLPTWQVTHAITYVAKGSHGSYPYSTAVWAHADEWYDEGTTASFPDFSWVLVTGNPTFTSPGPEYQWSLIQNRTIVVPGYGLAEEHPIYNDGYWPNRFAKYVSPWQRRSDAPSDLYDKNPIWDVTIPEGDSILSVSVACPVDIHLYDSIGRHVGRNYETGELDLEIPRAIYEVQADFQNILVYDPALGEYTVELVGAGDGSYVIFAMFSYGEAFGFQSQTGEIVEDAVHVYNVDITEEVMAVESDPIAELEHLKGFIENLPDDAFVTDDPDEFAEFQKELLDKINETLEELHEEKYIEAIEKLDDTKEGVIEEDKLEPTTQSDLCVIIDHIISSI